jgi:hypothetical protein
VKPTAYVPRAAHERKYGEHERMTIKSDALSVIGCFQTEFGWTDDTAILHLAEFIDHCELGERLAEYLTYITKEQEA